MADKGAHDAAFILRWADLGDVCAIQTVMKAAIDQLQSSFLTPAQIAASHQIMGLDTQLIKDGTYLLVEREGQLLGCGGWSARATLYGGDHSLDLRDPAVLDPSCDPAKIRAMYTNPAFVRRGVGRLVLEQCEQAAFDHGFRSVELMATMSGKPLYQASGYTIVETVEAHASGVTIPLARMVKDLRRTAQAALSDTI